MGYQNKILMRTSLDDEGVVGKRNFTYKSPDMISHTQVLNEKEFFSANYDSDPNMPLDKNSGTNFVYLRGKSKNEGVSGYMWLYCCGSSLFMKPSLWKNKKLYTVEGQSCVMISATEKDEIVVTDKPFVLNGLVNEHFCMVAITTDKKEECIPDDFATYDQFNYWVRTNMGVAVRNFTVLKNGLYYDYQRLDILSNPEDEEMPAMIKVSWTGIPDGYYVGVKCDSLPDLEKQVETSSAVHSMAASTILPVGFEGYVETFAYNTDGESSFPENATITTQFYTPVALKQLCYPYGKTLQELGCESAERIGLTSTTKMVLTGECSTVFV